MFVNIVNMKFTDLEPLLIQAGFTRTNNTLSTPLTIHGVPGCGKSTLILKLLDDQDVTANTLGPAYGDNLTHQGVTAFDPKTGLNAARIRILDEYQFGPPSALINFNVIFGDPYQGPLRLPAHYVKKTSHRIPRPVAEFLSGRKFEIVSNQPGQIITRPVTADSPLPSVILHLGEISRNLTHSHGICSRSPREVSGLEFDEVAVVYHHSEIRSRDLFYIAATRARRTLHLISDEFHELQTTA